MNTTLRRIIQEVNAAHDLNEALLIIVERIREVINTQAATLYLVDNHRAEYVLMATQGLNIEIAGELRVPFDTGLVGLVGRRGEPINIEDAQIHPNFYHLPDAGEDKYHAFLGVPIIHHRRLLGVLVIQREEQRKFEGQEEAFLVTIATQLATIIAHAETTGQITTLQPFHAYKREKSEESSMGGIPSASGVGIGQAMVIYPPADLDAVPDRLVVDVTTDLAQVMQALAGVREEIRQLSERLETTLPAEEHAVFDVYLRILESESLINDIQHEIEHNQWWAQAALKKVMKKHILQFEAMDDPYLRERASDFRDLGRRILAQLQATQEKTIEYPLETILIGEEITAAAIAQVPEGQLMGIVSLTGSSNSHVAIVARALGIPTVMGAHGIALSQLENQQIIVDGYFGQVYVAPSQRLLNEFRILAKEERELDESIEYLRGTPTETPDGYGIKLFVNAGFGQDAGLALSAGAEGVGLFRTEIPFMTREHFPVEDEQRVIYRQLLKAFSPKPVIMRTLDIGGDKKLPYFSIEEDNPFLGWRGIRVTLDRPDIFLVQLRAMLHANEESNNLKILLPMICNVGELDEALHLINQAYHEVQEEGCAAEKPEIGVMIEVPSAVYQARELARRVDFISVGSNDLTQYLLAVDRNNPRVAGLYDQLHPAVLQALQQIVDAAHRVGKPVSICGEMASDPVAIILLLAMGFDSLSMNSASLLRMKWVIANFPMAQARQLLDEVLEMENAALIRFHLEKAIDQAGLGGLIRAGKK